jgi:hypothetical protein
MSILPHILLVLLGSIVLLFFFWRRLKEDFSSELIFNAGITSIVSILMLSAVFTLIARFLPEKEYFRPAGMWFWGSTVGLLVGVKISQFRFNMKLVETLEAGALGSGAWLLLVYIFEFVVNRNQVAGILSAVLIFLLVLFYFLESRYRSFSWYKSGKVGFSGFGAATIFFVFRIISVASNNDVFSTIGRVDLILSAVAVFLLVFSLYNLSEAS